MDFLLNPVHPYNEDTFPYLNTDECREPTFQETKKNTNHLKWEDTLEFEAIDAIAYHDLSSLKKHFRHDTKFWMRAR